MNSRELMALVLGEPEDDELREAVRRVVANSHREDANLEFKSGLLLGNPDAVNKLQREVAAFANTDGGVVIVGIEDKDHKAQRLEGCCKGKGDVRAWASRALRGLLPALQRPRIYVVDIDGHEILVVAVDRSAALVPVLEREVVKYYIRIDESSHPLHASTYADLLLGRRQVPTMQIDVENVFVALNGKGVQITLSLQFHNDSPLWIPEFQPGAVGFDMTIGAILAPGWRRVLQIKPSEAGVARLPEPMTSSNTSRLVFAQNRAP